MPVEPQTFEDLTSASPTYIEEELDLWQALCQLEEKYKTVLLLRFYQDYSVKDIAAILQCPEGTVKTHIRRGLHALRQQLKGHISMSGFNPLKEVINAIPIPEGRLTEVLRVEGMSKIYQQKHHTVNALKISIAPFIKGKWWQLWGQAALVKVLF